MDAVLGLFPAWYLVEVLQRLKDWGLHVGFGRSLPANQRNKIDTWKDDFATHDLEISPPDLRKQA